MEQVIRITKKAADHLCEVLSSRAGRAQECLRLLAAPTGAGIVLDAPKPEDKVVYVEGKPVLLVPRVLAPILKGATLDYQDYPEGPCLTLFK